MALAKKRARKCDIGALLGRRIAERAHALDLSNQELADAIGVHRTTVTRWISGKADMRGRSLCPTRRALNTSISYLLGFTDDPKAVA